MYFKFKVSDISKITLGRWGETNVNKYGQSHNITFLTHQHFLLCTGLLDFIKRRSGNVFYRQSGIKTTTRILGSSGPVYDTLQIRNSSF